MCLNNYNSLKEIQEGTKKINTEEKEYYADKGFVYGNKSNETGSFVMEEGRYSPASNKERNIYYLDKISSLCEKKGVKLYFVSGPTSVERLYAVEGYQDAVDYYSQYAQRHGTKYFNLNYLIGRESFLPDEMMHDRNHVNGKGAELVSTVFAEILEKELEGEDVSAYFYSSLDELKKEVDRIVAVGYNISNSDGKIVINTKCLANEDVVPEYRISISADKSIYEIVSDFSETTEYMFDVTEYENCWVMIEVKQKGRENIDAYQKDISLKEGLK